MNTLSHILAVVAFVLPFAQAQDTDPPSSHPDSSSWDLLFTAGQSNAEAPDGVWTVSEGVLTASEDQCIWTKKSFSNYMLDLEFKTADSTNSGVIVHCADTKDWIPNSVEIQIADDHSEQWSKAPKTWQCAAIFGHLAASESAVKKPGEWNRFTITCKDRMIHVLLNGKHVTSMDMNLWTSAKTNPDGSEIPGWLNKPKAELKPSGRIGLQGKHAGAPIYFRNLRIRQLETPSGLGTILSKEAKVRKLAGDMKFTEGPVWLPKKEILVFSDIPNSVLMQWSEKGGLKEFRKSESSNGNLLDLEGRLLSCQHAGRNLIRWKSDGTAEELAGKFEGKRFNSPNDVAVKSDGTLWFTDPPWGLKNRREGREIEGNWVYRLNPDSGKVTVVTKSLDMPNGIAFSPNEDMLYVADTGKIPKVRAFLVGVDNRIDENPDHYLDVQCDGLCVDTKGNVYTTANGGIHVFDKKGNRIGLIPVDEHPANCAFGGADYKTLFITARSSLYSVRLNNAGAKPPGARW